MIKDQALLTPVGTEQERQEGRRSDGTGPPTITVNRVKNVIFDAAQKTYKDMWSEMKPKLRDFLENHEVTYYNSIAVSHHANDYQGCDGTPFKTVVAESEKVIGTTADLHLSFHLVPE